MELTERGRREVGMWPNSSDGNALTVIEQAANRPTMSAKGFLQ